MDTTICKAGAGDYDTLCTLFNEGDALHREHLPRIFQQPGGAAREREYFLGLISDENVALLVADVGETLVGFVHAYIREAPALPVFVPRRYALVDEVVVRADFRNHGIGRRLMHEMEMWARAKGATSLELNVYEFNRTAIAFYERLGYETLSRKMSKPSGTTQPGTNPGVGGTPS